MGRTKQFSRNEVLDKSIRLFWKQGFADTSLQDLEKATGVNKSGLYSEFKGKEDLFTHCVQRYADSNKALEILNKEPLGRTNLRDLILASATCRGPRGCFVANSIREMSILPKAAKNQIEIHLTEIRQAVLKNILASESNEDQANLITDIILTFNSGLALRLNMGPVDKVETIVDQFLDRVFS